jgi:apolipoprotein D and lipocalin family protein
MKKAGFITTALAASAVLLLISSFKLKNKNIDVVKPFDQKKYLGKWYEIARLDYSWERNLDNVTATYSLREDGKIRVDNKGYDTTKNKWKESVGKARPTAKADEGRLEVSFFGPFYSEYNVVAVDESYEYALVAGESTKYLWILSRHKTVPDDVINLYLEKARLLGYQTENLIWVKHDRAE